MPKMTTATRSASTEFSEQISVRDLVEFVLKSGDIDNRRTRGQIQDAMLLGARVHRKIQKAKGVGYSAEVSLKTAFLLTEEGSLFPYPEETCPAGESVCTADGESVDESVCTADGESVDENGCPAGCENAGESVCPASCENAGEDVCPAGKAGTLRMVVEGRADGIFTEEGVTVIDEIKGVFRNIFEMEDAEDVHRAQAEVYALIYAYENELPEIDVQITYVELSEEDQKGNADAPIRYFRYHYTYEEIEKTVLSYVESYRPFALFDAKHKKARKASAKEFAFPFPYREGQRIITRQVYRTIEAEKQLYVQAPTGTGKTAAMLYPAVQAVGQELSDKIFYLSAKTVAAAAAEDAMRIFTDHGLQFSYIRIIAKEKLCPLEKCECNPEACPRAKGHFDRVNTALYALITEETAIDTACIMRYAAQYEVCPYELCLDASYYCDVIICDYNYAFAPNVYLRRYFADGAQKDYIFLIDEAHNLPDRAREFYSASVCKEEILAAKKLFPKRKKILGQLEKVNRLMLALKRECTDVTVYEDGEFPNALLYALMELFEALSMCRTRRWRKRSGISSLCCGIFWTRQTILARII